LVSQNVCVVVPRISRWVKAHVPAALRRVAFDYIQGRVADNHSVVDRVDDVVVIDLSRGGRCECDPVVAVSELVPSGHSVGGPGDQYPNAPAYGCITVDEVEVVILDNDVIVRAVVAPVCAAAKPATSRPTPAASD